MKTQTHLIASAFIGLVLSACATASVAPTAAPAPATKPANPTSAAVAQPPQVPAPNPAPNPTNPPVAQANTSPIAPPLASPINPPAAAQAKFVGKTLRVVTHDSFALDKKLVAGFEQQTGAKVQILKSGDAGEMLNKVILSKASPLGDVVFGIDNTFLGRALSSGIFDAYAPAGLDSVAADLKLDKDNRLIPIDYGYVNLNYDLGFFKTKALVVPQTLRDLTKPEYKGMLVVQNPATSSPGLAFMLATIATFGETGTYTWKDFWRDLRKNEVDISSGWSQAYYDKFSGAGGAGKGKYPMVVSYSTSPAAEVFYSEGALKTPPTGNILPPKGVFRQIEFAGIVKGTKETELAKVWMDFMLSRVVQEDIAPSMAVYPVLPAAMLEETFAKYAPNVKEPADISPDLIAKNREKWLQEWTQVVLR
jgi:thiamine transport system substrate-binding protein